MDFDGSTLDKIDIRQLIAQIDTEWGNLVAAHVDNYVARVVLQDNDSAWHHHSTGDELFLVIEGQYAIDLDNTTIVLNAGQMFVVPKLRRHRTRALKRSIVVCFESATNDIKGS